MFPGFLKDKETDSNQENGDTIAKVYEQLPYLLLDAAKQWEIGFESYEEVIKELLDALLELHQKNEKLEKEFRDAQNKVTSNEFQMFQFRAALIKLNNAERSEHKLKGRVQALESRTKRQEEKIKSLRRMGNMQFNFSHVSCQTNMSDEVQTAMLSPSNNTYNPIERACFETPPFDYEDESSSDMISVGNEIEKLTDDESIDYQQIPFHIHIDPLKTSGSKIQYSDVFVLPTLLSPLHTTYGEKGKIQSSPTHNRKGSKKNIKMEQRRIIKTEYCPSESLDVIVLVEKLVMPPTTRVSSFVVERIANESFVTKNLLKSQNMAKKSRPKRRPKSRYGLRRRRKKIA